MHKSRYLTTRPRALVGALALAGSLLGSGARGATITVDTTNDDWDLPATTAPCSLREAISSINAAADSGGCVKTGDAYGTDDRIVLGATTYTLELTGADEDGNATGDLDVGDPLGVAARSVTIAGTASGDTAIDGGDLDRVFHVLDLATLRLEDLTVRNGSSTQGGGLLVENDGELTLERAVVEDNVAVDAANAGFGGGILSFGSLTLIETTVRGNRALFGTFGAIGGGLVAIDALRIERSTISGNEAEDGSGGGLVTEPSELGPDQVISNSTISGNVAAEGGGITNGACFTGDTPVWTESGVRPISTVRPGDRVWAWSETAGRSEWAAVEAVHPSVSSSLRRIELETGVVVRVTPTHPIWVVGSGWTRSGEIAPGDRLLGRDGRTIAVSSIVEERAHVAVFDLTVAGLHTYYVSDAALLVHNK